MAKPMTHSVPNSRRDTAAADDYLALVRRVPLVPIRTAAQLKEAHKMIDALSIIDENELTRGQADYLDVLGDLVDAHESKAFDDWLQNSTGLDLLKHLMEVHELNASDIGTILGLREVGSKVVRGERQISKMMAKTLGEHFHIPREQFLR